MDVLKNLRAGTSVFPLLAELRKLPAWPTPDHLVDVSLRHKVIAPLQVREEFLELSEIVADLRPKTILEIGTFRGGTLFVFARLAASDATLISLDLPVSVMGKIYRLAQGPLFGCMRRSGQSLHLLRKDSHQQTTVATVAAILKDRPLDFLFIDGDHTYNGVKSDFEMYSSLVRPGGAVAFHDINNAKCDVPGFWREVSSRFKNRSIIHRPGPFGMGIGVIWM